MRQYRLAATLCLGIAIIALIGVMAGGAAELPRVAVLDFRITGDAVTGTEADYLTDLVRGLSRQALPSAQYVVMTKENIESVLTPEQKAKIRSGTAEGGEVEVGRMLGATYIVSGEILKIGRDLKVNLKLHDAKDGNLLSTKVVSAASVKELESPLKQAATGLFEPLGAGQALGVIGDTKGAKSVEATGQAPFMGDEAAARDEAMVRARVSVAEKAAGEILDGQALDQALFLLPSLVKKEDGGIVPAVRLLREWKEGDNVFVKIEAWVLQDKAAKERALRALVSRTTVIVDIREEALGKESVTSYSQDAVEDLINKMGLRLVDSQQVISIRSKEAKSIEAEDRPDAVKSMGLRHLSNLLITGRGTCSESQINGTIHSGRTDVRIKGVATDSGTVLFPVTEHGVKGFGLSFDRACEDSRDKAAKSVSDQIAEGLKNYLASLKKTIAIEARNVKNKDRFDQLQEFLGNLPWVKDLQPGTWSESTKTATFQAPYLENPVYLASQFERSAEYSLVGFTDNKITVRLK